MNKRGVALIGAYMLIVVLTLIGAAFVTRSVSESRIAEREKDAIMAMYIAEAGIEQTLYYLKQDLIFDSSSPSWADGDVYSFSVGPDESNFYDLYGSSMSFGNGSYTVELKNVAGETDEIWVKSTGTYGVASTAKTIQLYARAEELSPWDNAIFAGAGASGSTLSGNVQIHGSMHILGTGLLATDTALDLSGSAAMGNNYSGMPVELSSRVPSLPAVEFGGETIESLGATLRVKNGRVDLSGSASIGEANTAGNSVKETLDAVYVNVGPYDDDNTAGTFFDGFGGNKGAGNVNSDNGAANSYDMGDSINFPTYASIEANITSIGYYSVSEDSIGTINSSTADFSYSGAGGSISWDQAASTLTIDGIVMVTDGADADSDSNIIIGDNSVTVEYTGQGTIVSDDVEIAGNLLSQGMFPATDKIGFVASDDIDLTGTAQLKIIGAFYAEDQITSDKQNEIAGAFISNFFDMGSNVPKIYQVPTLADSLPPGLDFAAGYRMLTSYWQEL